MREEDEHEVIVVRGKYAGMRGRVVSKEGAGFDHVGVLLDHPVQRLLGPAVIKATDVVPASDGSAVPLRARLGTRRRARAR
jgi:hypothetical protein